jgi:hypothetical protein
MPLLSTGDVILRWLLIICILLALPVMYHVRFTITLKPLSAKDLLVKPKDTLK